ncbi:MAG: sulfatase [Fidelibacterota bacterium]|nr:MAG: sulfatase [Candidatus Neomarinimicrobiota bacterium]
MTLEKSEISPPNLVFIFADQLRYQSCGYAGDERAHTPNMDRLADEGVNFCNAISGHPLCAPYRASLFTGKYSSSTGMVINELRMSPNHKCFGHVLQCGGYQTAYIGKWHLWAAQLGNHHDPKNSHIPAGPYRLGFDGYWAAYNFHHRYFDTYYHTDSPERIYIPGYEPDGQTELAIHWLEANRDPDMPFALILSYGTPHDPWEASNVPAQCLEHFREVDFPLPINYLPENDPRADDWGRLKPEGRAQLGEWMRIYYAMTANLDWNLGRLLKALDESGLRENTIVVFTSDHGELFGAHGRRAKNVFYEEAVRVPLLMRWPGHIPASLTSEVCLNTPDIMPTVLSLMDLPSPDTVEGMDLSHCALGQTGPEPEAAFLQGMGCTAAWRDGYEWRALRDDRYTYAVYRTDRSVLLFDNQADPSQMQNLTSSQEHANVRQHFREALEKRMETLGDTFELCTWYRDHWTKNRVILRTATLKD